jgi:predicted kinase
MEIPDISSFHQFDIILVCGLPGAGKSHFSRKEFMGKGRKRVNRKEIRRLLYEMTNFGESWSEEDFSSVSEHLVKHTERKIIEHLLVSGEKILIDNTSVTPDSRKLYARIADNMKKSAGVIFLDTAVSICLERNRNVDDPAPESIISKLAASKSFPARSEGFKRILILNNY